MDDWCVSLPETATEATPEVAVADEDLCGGPFLAAEGLGGLLDGDEPDLGFSATEVIFYVCFFLLFVIIFR